MSEANKQICEQFSYLDNIYDICTSGPQDLIGHCKALINNKEMYTVWVANGGRRQKTSGVEWTMPKNSKWGNAILKNSSMVGMAPGIKSFDVVNLEHFILQFGDVTKFKMWLGHRFLFETQSLKYQLQLIGTAAKEEYKRKQEELAKQESEIQRRIEEEKKRAQDEERKKQLEEERKRELDRIEEERIKAEEEEKERQSYLESIRKLAEKADDALEVFSFIRQNAKLQKNPILDDNQNKVKFSHLYDGTALVINGGPGTGKTTTLIQRLKLLIDDENIKDWNEKLSKKQIDLIKQNNGNWMFFSPTELLCQYLEDNMDYEGLVQYKSKTFVWSKFLQIVLRDNYRIAGEDKSAYSFPKKSLSSTNILTSGLLETVEDFTNFFISDITNRIGKTLEEIKGKKFRWNLYKELIERTCENYQSIKTIQELFSLFRNIRSLENQPLPAGVPIQEDILKEFNSELERLTSKYIVSWNKQPDLHIKLVSLVTKWHEDKLNINNASNEESDDDDETEEETENTSPNFDVEVEIYKNVKQLFVKIALRVISKDNNKLEGRSKDLYEIVKDSITEDDFISLADSAYFQKKVYLRIIKNPFNMMLNRISPLYKAYRRQQLKDKNSRWDLKFLETSIQKNYLTHQEQALIVGFINNLILKIYKFSKPDFDGLRHKYVDSYKMLCKPVIGVDEATDYDLLDYYAISSLRHYELSSFALTGDTMQCLKSNGITNWKELKHSLIFPQLEVFELQISYRQSPNLLTLAHQLYKDTIGTDAPYHSSMDIKQKTPEPLWLESNDEDEKVEWLASRIKEVKQAYSFLPSIAVFVKDSEEAHKLQGNLGEILEESGIEVVDCSQDDLKNNNPVRIFPINMVKGLEFQVVFFHNVENMAADKDMLNKYLYVGLSRATFYMGVTTSDTAESELSNLSGYFSDAKSWL